MRAWAVRLRARFTASEYDHQVNFSTIAHGFGIPSVNLDTEDDPARALRQALEHPGPVLVRSTVRADENVYPMVPPGAANADMLTQPEPEDEMNEPLAADPADHQEESHEHACA